MNKIIALSEILTHYRVGCYAFARPVCLFLSLTPHTDVRVASRRTASDVPRNSLHHALPCGLLLLKNATSSRASILHHALPCGLLRCQLWRMPNVDILHHALPCGLLLLADKEKMLQKTYTTHYRAGCFSKNAQICVMPVRIKCTGFVPYREFGYCPKAELRSLLGSRVLSHPTRMRIRLLFYASLWCAHGCCFYSDYLYYNITYCICQYKTI